MSTPVLARRTSWADVTLGEFAALDLLALPDTVAALNATWDDTHAHNPLRGDAPCRLTPGGEAWIVELRERVGLARRANDATEARVIAQDFLKRMGTLDTMATHRRACRR